MHVERDHEDAILAVKAEHREEIEAMERAHASLRERLEASHEAIKDAKIDASRQVPSLFVHAETARHLSGWPAHLNDVELTCFVRTVHCIAASKQLRAVCRQRGRARCIVGRWSRSGNST